MWSIFITPNIVEFFVHEGTHRLYDIRFFTDSIRTTVTRIPSVVTSWIADTEMFHNNILNRLVVGLDIEWRPTFDPSIHNPVATLQLCVGRRCLIFQILHSSDRNPLSLVNFLRNPNYTFVGVGIRGDAEKLAGNYGLVVANYRDLRPLAAVENGNPALAYCGLKRLCLEILGIEICKPIEVTISCWDNLWLDPFQVRYACLDAFLSFEIGRTLNAWRRP